MNKGIFVEEDFEIHGTYAVCPNGKRLNRKPNIFVRGSSEQWRYKARQTDCGVCPLRSQCTTGKGSKMLCVNVYREDLAIHAERMKADPERTRDLTGRHRAMSEGIVNAPDESPGRSLCEVERPGDGSRSGRPGHRHDQHAQAGTKSSTISLNR